MGSRQQVAALVIAAAAAACGDDGSSGSADAAVADAPSGVDAAIDAAMPDGGYVAPDYQLLSETGLYSDFGAKTIDPELIEYVPRYPLWSDGSLKRRWIHLPAGTTIDTVDMDNWRFPVGTKIFKQFSFAPEAGDPIIMETRLIERIADTDGPEAWWRGSFAWRDADGNPVADPALVESGELQIDLETLDASRAGQPYRVPDDNQCRACHAGTSHRVLGFQAIQLTGTPLVDGNDAPIDTDWLWAEGYLSHEPAAGGYEVPGDTTARAAIGYLHGNCGHCHGPPDLRQASMPCFDTTALEPDTPNMGFRVRTTDTTVEETLAYASAFDVATKNSSGSIPVTRLTAGNAAASAIHYRMTVRGSGEQMPPLLDGFSDFVDDDGVAAVQAWIDGLDP